MTYEKIETLSRLYNTLLLINTRGEDTIYMSDCLKSLFSFIKKEKEEIRQKEIENKYQEEEE